MNTFSWILVVGGTVLLALVNLFLCRRQTHESDAETSVTIAERDPKLDRVWQYLESFRHAKDTPSLEEILARFGKPSSDYEPQLVASEIASESSVPTVGPKGEPCEYYRFSDADLAAGTIDVQAWRYEYKGMDEFPWIDIYVRKADGLVIGWEWAWMERPHGNAIGPPQVR